MQNLKQLFEDRLADNLMNLDATQVLEEDLKNLNQLPEGYKPFIKYILQRQKGTKGIFISPNSEIYQVINGNALRFAAEINKANKSPNKVGAIVISSQTHLRVLKPLDDPRGKLFSNSTVHVVMDVALNKYDLEVGPQTQKIELREINNMSPYKMNDFLVNESKFSAFIICEDPAIRPKKIERDQLANSKQDRLAVQDSLGMNRATEVRMQHLKDINRYKAQEMHLENDVKDITMASDSALDDLFHADGKYIEIRGGHVGKFALVNPPKWSNILKGLIIGYLEIPGSRNKTVVVKINGVDAF